MNVWEMEQFQALARENMQLKGEIEELKQLLLVLSPYQDMGKRTFEAFQRAITDASVYKISSSRRAAAQKMYT